MSNDAQQQHYPTVEFVLNAVADWVNDHRAKLGANGFGQCSPDEVARIAADMGMSSRQLSEIVRQGPHAADQLQQMLIALKVDPKHVADSEPLVMRDLQRLCSTCGCKTRCAHELDVGTAAEHFDEFCPNAMTLDALVKEKAQAAK